MGKARITLAKAPKTLEVLFHDSLKNIYFAEKKILSMFKMVEAAHSAEFKAIFQRHHSEAAGHVDAVAPHVRLVSLSWNLISISALSN
jgi:ferritin-like metal-binding protein YciE